MNEHTQRRDSRRARHAAGTPGPHRGDRVRRAMLGKVSTAVVAAAAAAALVLAMTGPAGPAAHATPVQLTTREAGELQRLTPAQRQRIGAELDAAFSKLGMQAGIGEPGSAPATGTQLTSYDWSAGHTCCEAWVTASYANLHAAMTEFHTHAALLGYLDTVATALTGGVALAICLVLGGGILGLAGDGNFAPVSNHGVWFAVWWIPPHVQGGYW
jgi:hypothetical protein